MKKVRKIIIILLCSMIAVAVCFSGVLYYPDNVVADYLYQNEQALDGNIVIIGIDQKSIDEIGPWPWNRSIMAQAISTLNSDEEKAPAVIGVDVLFVGESEDSDVNIMLADAAAMIDNVVVASAAQVESDIVVTDDNFYMNEFSVASFDEPFTALKDVTTQGHINSFRDKDGVLRNAMLYLDLPDGRSIPSFNLVIYEKYCEYLGVEAENTPPLTSMNFWPVPFRAQPGGYSDFLSVSDLIAGDIPSDVYAGKIVLIGPYTAGLLDEFITPINRGVSMYGVEYQANAIDALIHGDFKINFTDDKQYILLFLLSALSLLWFWDRKVMSATIGWLVMTLGYVGVALASYNAGYILHPLWIPLWVTIFYVATIAANYIRAGMERQAVTDTFKRYVAPEIVTEILKEGTETLGLGGKLSDVAVLFVDIRGFTTMSEVLSPSQVVEILNKYLNLTSDCIFKNGGTLDKFIGDATMAFWGAPLPQEDYIYNAVKAGMDMIEGAEELGRQLEVEFGRTVSFGIGVHCGKAVIGNIGAASRMDYTAIGDTVNTAARLESNAPPGKLLISRAVADALGGRIVTTSLGEDIKLKGKSEGFEILIVDKLM